ATSRRGGGGVLNGGLRNAVRHARVIFHAYPVVGAFAGGEERLPGDPRGIVDPRFFGLRIATGRRPLLAHRSPRSAQTRVDIAQLVLALDLNAEVIEARLFAAGRDR